MISSAHDGYLIPSQKNELVPMSTKYFFHATAERIESEDYYNEGDDLESRSPQEASLRMSVSPGILVDAEVSESKEEDSEMQEWLQIGPGSDAAENPGDDADSVTDPDSGNEDNWFIQRRCAAVGGYRGVRDGGGSLCESRRVWRLLGNTSSTPTMMSMSK
jgi:hypothetical protein